MSWQTIDQVVRGLALPVAGGIFLNQLDELFIDANYLLRGLHRRRRRTVPWKTLEKVQQKNVAILVPAWHEAEVIRQMLEHNLTSLDHDRSRYTIFCGTYCNDPETQAEVDTVARRFPGVRKVVVPHAGPTSKADCLNWIYQGIVLDEQKRGRRYDILLMHDAEDVIHPLSLRLYSLLIPRYQFVQTPVFSLELKLTDVVAATYIDEFAEHHQKDMLVREAIGGLVPSAGVGSAFDRDAFEDIARSHGERPFNVESLTEDYEIGLKFRLAGKRVHFACRSVELRPAAGDKSRVLREEMIATREYFPGGFRASVRQRSRWILGISLQTWRQIGWRGSLPVLYCLWRDRKTLFTNTLVCLAYLLVGYGAVRAGLAAANVAPPVRDIVVGADDTSVPARMLGTLLAVNLVAMGWRALTKARLVARLYGWGHALLSAPRMVLGNVISLAATARAVSMFIKHMITGAPLRWLKTAHVFPNVEALQSQRRRLGEILTERNALDPTELDEALAVHRELGRPLGEVLSMMGLASDRAVAGALAEIHDLAEADVESAPADVLMELGEAEAERLGVVPVAGATRCGVRLAAGGPLDADALRGLELRLGKQVEVVIASPADVRQRRQRAYRSLLAGTEMNTETEHVNHDNNHSKDDEADAADADKAARDSEDEGRKPLRFAPEDVDWDLVARLGRGFCALYAMLPLRAAVGHGKEGDGGHRLAAAFPLHQQVRDDAADRLGASVTAVAASALDVDVALALLQAYADDPGRDFEITLKMLALLDSDGGQDATQAAFTRARLLGLPTAEPDPGLFDWPVLPPAMGGVDPIFVRGLADRSMVLATQRPTPRLARTVAAFYPSWAIAWQVALPPDPTTHEEDPQWTTRMFEAIGN